MRENFSWLTFRSRPLLFLPLPNFPNSPLCHDPLFPPGRRKNDSQTPRYFFWIDKMPQRFVSLGGICPFSLFPYLAFGPADITTWPPPEITGSSSKPLPTCGRPCFNYGNCKVPFLSDHGYQVRVSNNVGCSLFDDEFRSLSPPQVEWPVSFF